MKRRRTTIAVFLSAAICVMGYYLFDKLPPAADVFTEDIKVGSTTRSYRVVVPHSLKDPAPVVFAFHGVGDSPEGMAEYTGLDRLAAREGVLLVYPAGHNASWDAVEVEPELLEENADVQFFDAMLRQITERYSIDRRRVYLLGMSNGTAFVQLLAHARSGQIAAVVAHSGICPKGLKSPERKFPILLLVGSEDHAADAIRTEYEHYRAAGHEAELIEVEGLGHAWSKRHNSAMWEFLAAHELEP